MGVGGRIGTATGRRAGQGRAGCFEKRKQGWSAGKKGELGSHDIQVADTFTRRKRARKRPLARAARRSLVACRRRGLAPLLLLLPP